MERWENYYHYSIKKIPILPQNCLDIVLHICFAIFPTILNYKKEEMERKRQKEINIFVKQIWHKAYREKRR